MSRSFDDRAPTGASPPPTVGMVGGGQLARMTHQAAIGLGVPLRIMVAGPDDSAAQVCPWTRSGDPHSADDLVAFATECDVITFDHELVDLDGLASIDSSGSAAVRPPASALAFATDKAHQRRVFSAAGLPLPAHRISDDVDEVRTALDELGWPVVVKTARGGYDGRGVWVLDDAEQAEALLAELADGSDLPELIVEALVDIACELAVLVARRPDGEAVTYPVVETVQVDGICRETIVPARIPAHAEADACELALEVAELVGAVGIIAVELFFDGEVLAVNEVATRPHNSGHWSIEGAVTSQFANHLRAVADLPLGATDVVAGAVVSANVLGHSDGRDPRHHLGDALAVPGAAIHLYGKAPRPGRKLGHVTVMADTVDDARLAAHRAVAALGDPVPDRP
ncbi:MAG: 5-(carboxyamino)imidazole ribonucleotide synthase [Acidimicrobiales bacterium]